ncbi:MAG: hypothetical protein HPY46_09470 [Candidatus Aminicenantes bacterium]|nr:hypothetical protein [Candidatus Aminicenantes bacterium]
MKVAVAAGLILTLCGLVCILTGQVANRPETRQQETVTQTPPDQVPPQEVQKPKLDYMSTFLSRTTSPLGLKEDEELRRLLKQPKTNWALRAGIRHILN